MRYVESKLDAFMIEETYRIYVTDSLQLNPQGMYNKKRYYEVIHGNQPVEDGDEIAYRIITGAGLRAKDECI